MTNLGGFFTTLGQAFPVLDGIIKMHQATWSAFSTSVSTYNLDGYKYRYIRNISNSLIHSSRCIYHNCTNGIIYASTSVATYMTSMSTNIAGFATKAAASFTQVAASTKLSSLHYPVFVHLYQPT